MSDTPIAPGTPIGPGKPIGPGTPIGRGTPIGPGTRITLKFSLALESGDLIDSTGDKTATFEVGDESMLPGFEKAMFGMRAGESAALQISPEHGFGEPNEDNIHIRRKSEFASDMEFTEGLVVSFADGDGSEIAAVVTRIFGDTVEVDFNHPLAGKALVFDVEIVSVEQVSNDILRVRN